MRTYLVGGAVRDELLGLAVKERDWVVVGESPESMVKRGFQPVGKEFPVFLHPKTHEEYALARTEKKIAPGYRGFRIQSSPEVTLEQDLLRRDLTINAIARDGQGRIIDPYHGRRDLDLRRLRHVSDAFCEDPVRILRVARFSARYFHLGFRVADETMELMKSMVRAGEVDALVPERVWAEFARALSEKTPAAFIRVLQECDALEPLFPEIACLFGESSDSESDFGAASLRALESAARISKQPEVRFAVLVYRLGQIPGGASDSSQSGLRALNRLCTGLRTPNAYRSLAAKVLCCRDLCENLLRLSAREILDLLQRVDALRQPRRLEAFIAACHALSAERNPHALAAFAQGDFLIECQSQALQIDGHSVLERGFQGSEVGKELSRLRIERLQALIERNEARQRPVGP